MSESKKSWLDSMGPRWFDLTKIVGEKLLLLLVLAAVGWYVNYHIKGYENERAANQAFLEKRADLALRIVKVADRLSSSIYTYPELSEIGSLEDGNLRCVLAGKLVRELRGYVERISDSRDALFTLMPEVRLFLPEITDVVLEFGKTTRSGQGDTNSDRRKKFIALFREDDCPEALVDSAVWKEFSDLLTSIRPNKSQVVKAYVRLIRKIQKAIPFFRRHETVFELDEKSENQ